MDVFASAFEIYPILSGFILIGIGIICSFFQIDSQNKKTYKNRTATGKSVIIGAWNLIIFSILAGLIFIFKNI